MTPMRGLAAAVAALALLAALPAVVESTHLLSILIVVFIFAILAAGLDLAMGYCGQYSFAQGAFYGVGAYTAAIMHRDLGFGFLQAMPFGVLFAAGFGLIVGMPALRLSGHFLAITTIAFQTIVYLVLTQWTSFTGGQFGIPVPPIGAVSVFGVTLFEATTTRDLYFVALAVMIVSLAVAWRLARSRIGKEWLAIHDDELLARSIGLNTTAGKLTAFAASAALAGAAGVVAAYYVRGVSPTDFSIWTSATVVAMVIVGGRGSIVGPILGAAVLTLLPEVLRPMRDYRLIVFGALMILMVTFMPRGLAGLARRQGNG